MKDNDQIVKELRKDFPILDKEFEGKKRIYFDNAATSQKPRTVINSAVEFYENYNGNVHRSGHQFAIKASLKVEESRTLVKEFINAEHNRNIIFNSGTTEGINKISTSLFFSNFFKEGDEIISTLLEHNSNILPWINIANFAKLNIKLAKPNEVGIISPSEIEKLITNRTKIIAMCSMNNVLGTIQDIETIGKIARENNILFLVDAAQMASHLKIDVKKINCDFLVFSGHKMLAPTGIGVLYISDRIIDKLESASLGGNTVERITIKNNKLEYKTLNAPNKFEAGTLNIAGIIGLGEAIKYINKVSMDFIVEYDKEMISYAMEKLKEINEIKFVLSPEIERKSIISFNAKGIHSQDLETFLDTMGIAVRAGKNCAYLAFHSEKIKENHLLRASFYFYNTKQEVDFFVEALKKTIHAFS